MKTVYDTFSKKGNYTYKQVYSKVSRLQKNIKTDSTAQISQDKVSGIFIKYAVAGKLYSKNPVTAENMVNFLYDNMDTNELLRDRIDDQKRTDIENASDDISRAKNLFKGDNYSRYLINVSIPVESQESFEFVEQFNDELKAVYGDEAYAAGEMITTYDLKESFAHDLKLISNAGNSASDIQITFNSCDTGAGYSGLHMDINEYVIYNRKQYILYELYCGGMHTYGSYHRLRNTGILVLP